MRLSMACLFTASSLCLSVIWTPPPPPGVVCPSPTCPTHGVVSAAVGAGNVPTWDCSGAWVRGGGVEVGAGSAHGITSFPGPLPTGVAYVMAFCKTGAARDFLGPEGYLGLDVGCEEWHLPEEHCLSWISRQGAAGGQPSPRTVGANGGSTGVPGAKKMIFSKIVPRPLGMLKQVFLGRFEPVVARFGPWKILWD